MKEDFMKHIFKSIDLDMLTAPGWSTVPGILVNIIQCIFIK